MRITDLIAQNYSSVLVNFKAMIAGDTSACTALFFLKTLGFSFVAIFGLRLLIQHISLRRLFRKSVEKPSMTKAMDVQRNLIGAIRKPALRFTPDGNTPFVAGIFKPVIFFPVQLLDKLEQKEYEGALAHELAHIQRYDNLRSLLYGGLFALSPFVIIQMFAHKFLISNLNTLIAIYGSIAGIIFWKLFLQKAVLILRELKCDQVAAGVVGSKHVLASAILKTAKLSSERKVKLPIQISAQSTFIGHSNSERRIRILLDQPDYLKRLMLLASNRYLIGGAIACALLALHFHFGNQFQPKRFTEFAAYVLGAK